VARFTPLPRLLGYLAVGMLVGPHGLGWESPHAVPPLLVDLAIALLVFEAGYRANPRWILHNGGILAMSVAEAALTVIAVGGFMLAIGAAPLAAIVVATVALVSSPVGIVLVVQDARAAGQVTERLFLAAALATIYAAVAAKATVAGLQFERNAAGEVLVVSLYFLAGSVGLAGAAAWLLRPVRGLLHLTGTHVTALLFAALLLIVYVAQTLKLSPLIAALAFGVFVRRYVQPGLALEQSFGVAGIVLVAALFLVLGSSLDPAVLPAGGAIALGVVLVRTAAKVLGSVAFASPSGLAPAKGVALGIALAPASAIALALFEDMRRAFPEALAPVVPTAIATILLLEFAGPVAAYLALRWARETSQP
jgi:Kef-type K+ transport system membrane component KefB